MRALSKPATSLLERVQGHVGSYPVKKAETKHAKELVDKEYCFYSMDYEHLGCYKYPETYDTGSLGPTEEERTQAETDERDFKVGEI